MRQLDKLLQIAAAENKLTKHELEIEGQDLTFWSKPLTIADYQVAKRVARIPPTNWRPLHACSSIRLWRLMARPSSINLTLCQC